MSPIKHHEIAHLLHLNYSGMWDLIINAQRINKVPVYCPAMNCGYSHYFFLISHNLPD